MIPEFILENVFDKLEEGVYYCSTKNRDGWIIYWVEDNETFHTYRCPTDWWDEYDLNMKGD